MGRRLTGGFGILLLCWRHGSVTRARVVPACTDLTHVALSCMHSAIRPISSSASRMHAMPNETDDGIDAPAAQADHATACSPRSLKSATIRSCVKGGSGACVGGGGPSLATDVHVDMRVQTYVSHADISSLDRVFFAGCVLYTVLYQSM